MKILSLIEGCEHLFLITNRIVTYSAILSSLFIFLSSYSIKYNLDFEVKTKKGLV